MNIAELLKDCPKGTKLYSPVCGWVELEEVTKNKNGEVTLLSHIMGIYDHFGPHSIEFLANGEMCAALDTECVLFPSKDNRDWSTFVPPCKFKPFDRVVVRDKETDYEWFADLFSHYDADTEKFVCLGSVWAVCLPYNEETAKLIGTTDDYNG